LLAKEFGDKVRVKVYENLNDVGLIEITLDNPLANNSGAKTSLQRKLTVLNETQKKNFEEDSQRAKTAIRKIADRHKEEDRLKTKDAPFFKPYRLTQEEMEKLREGTREAIAYAEEHREELLARMGMSPSETPKT
jgi:hypothetical protein